MTGRKIAQAQSRYSQKALNNRIEKEDWLGIAIGAGIVIGLTSGILGLVAVYYLVGISMVITLYPILLSAGGFLGAIISWFIVYKGWEKKTVYIPAFARLFS